MRRVALNLAADRTRRLRRKLAALARIGPPPVVPPISEDAEDALAVAAALRTLPPAYRQVLVLHYLVDLSVEQIAGESGIRSSTVRGRLARARRVLASHFTDHTEEVRTTNG